MIESTTWLITGADRGLGRALTFAVLDAGHHVVATTRGESSLPAHDRLRVPTLDVRDRDDTRRRVEEAASLTGRLDVVVNNAGYGLLGAIEEVSETRTCSARPTCRGRWGSRPAEPPLGTQPTRSSLMS